MNIELNLEGISTTLEIKNYYPPIDEAWKNKHCDITFSVWAKPWLDYHKENQKILLCSEVEHLRNMLKKLLLDELSEKVEISFEEWDFAFILHPKEYSYQLTLFESDYPQVQNSYVEWSILLSDEETGYTRNSLTLRINNEQVEHLKNYLNLVTGVIDESNPVIQCMINQGILGD